MSLLRSFLRRGNVSFHALSDETRPDAVRSDTIRGTLIFAAAGALFGMMAFTVKLAAGRGIGGPQIAVIRFAFGLLPLLLIPSVRRRSLVFQRFDLLLYRGVFGGLAVLCYFSAIEHVPVGIATLLNYTTPVFSGIYAALFAGEPIRAKVLAPLAVAFSGVFLVVSANGSASAHFGFGRWELVALCSAVFAGAAVTSIRVARRTENSWAIFTSFSLFGLITTLPFGLRGWTKPDPTAWLLLAVVGVLSIVAQLFMTHAFRWVQTLIGGVISQIAVLVSMTLGILVLGERLTTQSALGATLTFGGVIAVMLVSSRGFVKEQ